MAKSKKVSGYIDLTIPAGKANPAPPIGSALGQRGVNIMEFCKAFNDKTSNLEPGTPTPVKITVFADKSFEFITKTPPASFFIKKFAKVKKGSGATRKEPYVASISDTDLEEIAKLKLPDLNANDIDGAKKIIKGSAESMGIEVK